MRVIVDSGSTKADWVFLVGDRVEAITSTLGLNPEVLSPEDFVSRVGAVDEIVKRKDEVKELYFYGAGCASERTKEVVRAFASSFFPKCSLMTIYEDTYAAVFATIGQGNRGIVCINGTGSNVSYFDGEQVLQRIQSLGFMAMDDCSGSSFGREMIKSYYLHMMPERLASAFETKYNLDVEEIKYNFYQKENPNAYLASFVPFLIENKEDPFFKEMIYKQIEFFVKYYVKSNPEYKEVAVHFIGSLAHFLKDEFKTVLEAHDIVLGNIVQKPLEGLIAYHINRI